MSLETRRPPQSTDSNAQSSSGLGRSRFLGASFGLAFAGAARRAIAQTKPATIRVGVIASDGFAEPYFAQEMGFFQKAGLSVDVQTLANSSAISAAVVGGALDVGVTVPITLANAVARRVSLLIVAPGALNTLKEPAAWVTVAKDGSVASARALEGKTVAVTGIKSMADVSLDLWLEKNGADPSKVTRVEMAGTAMGPAIERGTVAGAVFTEPTLSDALKAGQVRVIGNPLSAVAPQMLISVWYATTDFIEKIQL